MRDELGRFVKGQHYSVATEFKKGRINLNKKQIKKVCGCGKIFYVKPSLNRVKFCSRSCAGKKRILGENNPLWRGNKVGYRPLHLWVERQLGKAKKCSNDITHKSSRYHWANISGEYR